MTFDEVQKQVIAQNGWRTWYGRLLSPNELSVEQEQVLATQTAQYIVAHPDEFTPAQVAIASGRIGFSNSKDYALPDTSVSAGISEFITAYGQEVKKAANVTGITLKTALYIFAGVLAVVLVFRFAGAPKMKGK